MAVPVTVQLTCPLCATSFRARAMGSSYFISGSDTDLREQGSIEEVRRYSVATCPCCRLSDYTWNFDEPEPLDPEEREQLARALEWDPARGRPPQAHVDDFERFRLAERCFQARGLDSAALGELALLAYYVARDLGRRDLEPGLRDEAAALFAKALEEEAEEDLPPPLRLRYAYLAGELQRRAGRREEALRHLDVALRAARGEADPNARDLASLARRMHTRAQSHDAPAGELLALMRDGDADAAREARLILAGRRDRASVEATLQLWRETDPRERTALLRELVIDPSGSYVDLFLEALQGNTPEAIRLGARGLGALGDKAAAKHLVWALERGVPSTEGPLVEALRQIDGPGQVGEVARILEKWEQSFPPSDPEAAAWHFGPDPAPLRSMLYVEGGARGLELLIRDMRQLIENDLWDKVPSGGPVSAALALRSPEVVLALRGLLAADRSATRRWAAFCLAELGATEAAADLRPLLSDADPVVRLQACASLGRLGESGQAAIVLRELRALPEEDVPFALHFLVPFRGEEVKAYLRQVLERGLATPGEVLPLLGRQPADEELTGLLTGGLLDTDDDTRAGAVTGLAYQGGPGVPARLRALYDAEESDEVRRRIVFGLGQLARAGRDREETVAFLRHRLSRGTPILRFSVALTLLQLGDPSGIDVVRERAALFSESFDRYDLVAPALKVLATYDAGVRRAG